MSFGGPRRGRLSRELLLGDSFMVDLPGLGQKVPVPAQRGALHLAGLRDPPGGEGPRPSASAQAGPRTARRLRRAGRASTQALPLRSTDFLGYLGAFDYALRAGARALRPARGPGHHRHQRQRAAARSPTQCPIGHARTCPTTPPSPACPSSPGGSRALRTEVVLPKLPGDLRHGGGGRRWRSTRTPALLPVGFASATPRPAGPTAPARSTRWCCAAGRPTTALEIATPGIWALAGNASGDAFSAARLTAAPRCCRRRSR